jgi:hypothetical protein
MYNSYLDSFLLTGATITNSTVSANLLNSTNYQGTNLANGGSSAGQILTATSSGVAWSNAPVGSSGQPASAILTNLSGLTSTNQIVFTNSSLLGIGAVTATNIASNQVYQASIGMTLIATSNLSATASCTIPNLSVGVRYKLILNLLQNTSNGRLSIRFNADSGANYGWILNHAWPTGVGGIGVNSGDTNILEISSGDTALATSYMQYELLFQTVPGNNHNVIITGNGMYKDNNSNLQSLVSGGIYVGASDLTSISIITSAGTLTGTATIYTMN